MNKKIVIAGGTGFIGNYFSEKFRSSGYDVILISRQSDHIAWNDERQIIEALENAELLINLAGKSVDCRYTRKNKSAILKSRLETTSILRKALLSCVDPPSLWINASATALYPESGKPSTESSPAANNSFVAVVVKKWEEEFYSGVLQKTRRCSLRISTVLGMNGGIIRPLRNLVKFGLGGTQGKGNQMFSWIHMEDLYEIVCFIHTHKEINGPVNCTSPYPVSNKELMQCLRNVIHVKIGIPSPSFIIRLGAFLLQTEPQLVLGSTWVIPQKLMDAGFIFKYPLLNPALQNIIKGR